LRREIERCLGTLTHGDLDWNSGESWDEIADYAERARKKGLATPAIVDRMILFAAHKGDLELCTADKALRRLAEHLGVKTTPL
jgi:hypothetical protein